MSRPRPKTAAAAQPTPTAPKAALAVRLCASTPLSPRAEQLRRALEHAGATVELADDHDLGPADIVLWTDPLQRTAPMPTGPVAGVIDLYGAPPPAAVIPVCIGAALLLVGSEAELGFWTAALAAAGLAIPLAIVPYAPTPIDLTSRSSAATLAIIQGPAPSAATLAIVVRAASWAAQNGLQTSIADPAGITGLQALALAGPAPEPGPEPGAATLLLDARCTQAEHLATPDAFIDALAHGTAILACADTPFARRLEAAGALLLNPDLEPGLDQLAARRQPLSDAARAYARASFDPARAAAALAQALGHTAATARRRADTWRQQQPHPSPALGQILVISDEALNLVDIRVHLPLAALHRRGVIAGYTILRHGEIAFSTAATPDRDFDAIWVHRSVDAGIQLLLQVLDRPYVYDVDDNLLVSPSYRTTFPAETIEAAHTLIRGAAVLSCATPVLFRLLQRHSALRLGPKTVITPNLAHGEPLAPEPGPPRAVIWASSDQPALTGSRAEVERAVRDFCLAHRLRLVCLGVNPPPILAQSEVEIEHPGLLSYNAYLATLRRLAPAILVCPLETGADGPTQDFVDGKSDVKVMEARLCGLVGVFSRARPYRDSDLAPAIVCDNTYDSWLDGLDRAARACRRPPAAGPWPEHRAADRLGPIPWAEALARARLPAPLPLSDVLDAVRFVRDQQETLLGSRDAFDEAYYLARHDDVRLAVEQGIVASGLEHYRTSGYNERRAARRKPTAQTASDTWWAALLQTVARLETDVQARAPAIEALRARAALRHARRPAAVKGATPGPGGEPAQAPQKAAHPTIDLTWHPPGRHADRACPICDAPGPHPALLRADDQILLRCTQCATCFYEQQVVYDYERDKDSGVLLQLYLEQNASIYHQTRPLFAIDDPAIDSLLDVGCGFGYPVDLAAKVLGWRATGLDPSYNGAAGAALLHADIRKEYLTEHTDLGEPYALVTASEVIEHVPDPYAFLALFRHWLRPGGTLVITTPDAAALTPNLGPASLVGILALKVHMILFTKDSLALALRRAGFRHVQVESEQDNLMAYASDRPLRFRADAAERHVQTYKAYLEHLVETAELATPLWNGAAGRLLGLTAHSAALADLHALFARIAPAWRDRYGIDIARHRWPDLLPETAFVARDDVTRPDRLAATQPLNLATILFARAVLEDRTPGRTPEAVLAYARPAYRFAVQTRRVLQAEDMIDLDLKRTAWRARQLTLDSLIELAPELEGELLRAWADPSPGALHDRIDPPGDAITARITPWFTRAVHADRFDDASRLEPWMRDLDLLCTTSADDPERLFRALFTVGVLRLVHQNAPGPALDAFERMEREARLLLANPAHEAGARHFLAVAEEHVRLAAARLAPEGDVS
ncbi:MAG: hypothetical protein NVSMB18_34960 [Acetobacteraceae bacterium]